jgi:hypothetical protein
MSDLHLQRGDHVRLRGEDLDAVVVEVKTRTIVVRVVEPSGQSHERQVAPADVERLPTTKEALLETRRARPTPVITFAVGQPRWLSIDDAHVREDRVPAWITALHTMYGELKSDGIEQSVELLGFHHRRVLMVSAITGHEVFHKMKNAWDDYKMHADRFDIPEKRTLDILHVVYANGTARLDAEPAYAYAFVSVSAPPADMQPFTVSAKALFDRRNTVDGLQGGALFSTDDEGRAVLFTRWSGSEMARAFVSNVRNRVVLSPLEHLGDEAEVFEVTQQLA